MSMTLKGLVSKHKRRFKEDGFDLDLSYISDRIIAMGFPAEKLEGVYRNHIDDVVKFLQARHPNHYKLFHLCDERNFDPCRFSGPVAKYPFRDHNAPQFEQIIALCTDVAKFLDLDKRNVVVINCKAGKGRTGVMVCGCLLHLGLASCATDALKLYGEKRTDNGKGVTIPSQRRYVQYYDTLLSENLVYRRIPLYLKEIRISGLRTQPGSIIDVKLQTYPTTDEHCLCTCQTKLPDHHSPRGLAPKTGYFGGQTSKHKLADASSSPTSSCSSLNSALERETVIFHSEPTLSPVCGFGSGPLVTISTLTSLPVYHDPVTIYADKRICLIGDIRVKVGLRQPVRNRNLCRLWFNTFFVAFSTNSRRNTIQREDDNENETDTTSGPNSRAPDYLTKLSALHLQNKLDSAPTKSVAATVNYPIESGNSPGHATCGLCSGSAASCERSGRSQESKVTAREITLKLSRSQLDKVHKSHSTRVMTRDFAVVLTFELSAGAGDAVIANEFNHDQCTSVAHHARFGKEPVDKVATQPVKIPSPLKSGLASLATSLNPVVSPFSRICSLRLPGKWRHPNSSTKAEVVSLSDLDDTSRAIYIKARSVSLKSKASPMANSAPLTVAHQPPSPSDHTSEDSEEEEQTDTDSDASISELVQSPMATNLLPCPLALSLSFDAPTTKQQTTVHHSSPLEPNGPSGCSAPKASVLSPYTENPVTHHFIRKPAQHKSQATNNSR
ncbi:Phosphatidylinositol 3,4,5-trisphosphate 3-phosphatase and dual-specificity protein phosphatase pten [Clonorchis sinensis]|uniref:Phosphatidylinositol 3,4,5-trisphosphate 3-phosphatase and dual-specificity protein phosphatase PTEN n=1 Tax=Clonorchis sinensis TaxID=79923 RepID=A0A8T1M9E0_CLOSI|nr:Phosphatidylinositol 3,4,5-trisphosphate 3-phosphatase and dual-specificity protein phosphatase pten [Clonorchis sinensis]